MSNTFVTPVLTTSGGYARSGPPPEGFVEESAFYHYWSFCKTGLTTFLGWNGEVDDKLRLEISKDPQAGWREIKLEKHGSTLSRYATDVLTGGYIATITFERALVHNIPGLTVGQHLWVRIIPAEYKSIKVGYTPWNAVEGYFGTLICEKYGSKLFSKLRPNHYERTTPLSVLVSPNARGIPGWLRIEQLPQDEHGFVPILVGKVRLHDSYTNIADTVNDLGYDGENPFWVKFPDGTDLSVFETEPAVTA